MHLSISIQSQQRLHTLTVGPFSDEDSARQRLRQLINPSSIIFDSLSRVRATGKVVSDVPVDGCTFSSAVHAEAIVAGCCIPREVSGKDALAEREFESGLLKRAQEAAREELARRRQQ